MTPIAPTRRHFLTRTASGLGAAALASLLRGEGAAPHHTPKVKRVIYLFQSGGPSQMDMFDYKPRLADLRAQELPGSIRMGQRLTGMTATQTSFPVAPSVFPFAQHGQSGAWASTLVPHLAKTID